MSDFTRVCMVCGATFEEKDTLNRLYKHKEECFSREPYKGDNDADYYLEEPF